MLGLWVQAQLCQTFLKRTRHQVLFHVKEFYTCIQFIFIISNLPMPSSSSPGSPQHILLSTSCLLFLNNPLSPDSDAYTYMSLGPPTEHGQPTNAVPDFSLWVLGTWTQILLLAGQVLLPAELRPMLCAAESDLLNFVEDFAAYEDMFLVCHFLFSRCLHLSLDLK